MGLGRKREDGEDTGKIKKILEIEWETPGYLVREELKREKLKLRTAKRTRGFEKGLMAGGRGDVSRKWKDGG